MDTYYDAINLFVINVLLAKILNSVWLSFDLMILVKVGYNLAPGAIVYTLYFAISNPESLCSFCILKKYILRQSVIVCF